MANQEIKANLQEWTFPTIGDSQDVDMNVDGVTSYVFAEIETNIVNDEVLETNFSDNQAENEQAKEESEKLDENATQIVIDENPIIELNKQEKDQLEMMINEYEKKIHLLNDVLFKLKNPISVIDEEVIDIMQDIIKKTVERIIHQEIQENKDVLIKMINELKGMVPDNSSFIKIVISEADMQKLGDDIKKIDAPISTNPSMKEGDVIVKSEFNEVRAILSERIDSLLRVKHE